MTTDQHSQKYLHSLVSGTHLFFGAPNDMFSFYVHAFYPAAHPRQASYSFANIQARIARVREQLNALTMLLPKLEHPGSFAPSCVAPVIWDLLPECFLSMGALHAYRKSLEALRTRPGASDAKLQRLHKIVPGDRIEEWVLEVPLGSDMLSHPLLWKSVGEAILHHAVEKYSTFEAREELIRKVQVKLLRLELTLNELNRYRLTTEAGFEDRLARLLSDYETACLYVYGYHLHGTVNHNGMGHRVKHYLGTMLPGHAHEEWRISNQAVIEEKAAVKLFDGFRRLDCEENLDAIINRVAKSQVRDYVTVNQSWNSHQNISAAVAHENKGLAGHRGFDRRQFNEVIRSFGLPVSLDSQSCVRDATLYFENHADVVEGWLKTHRERFCVWLALVFHDESADNHQLKKAYTQQQLADFFGISRRSAVTYVERGRWLIRQRYEPLR